MSPQGPSFVRPAVLTAAALLLGLGMCCGANAQAPVPRTPTGGYREPGPIVAEELAPRSPTPGSRGGTGTTNPVMTPGYFEVVCPAICYGGAFHVCGRCAFGGAGYYGPFRRYWGYSTYGPNINIGPDNSIQYGLQGGVIYEAMRRCKGLRKHGCDPGAYAAFAPQPNRGGGSLVGGSGQMSGGGVPPPPAAGPARKPPEKLPPPTENSAHLRLLVPENAEVFVEGRKTTTSGAVREFASPPLQPGKNMLYSILVRYTDAGGKPVEETHSVQVRANDQLSIDCTKPANAAPSSATAQRPGR